MIRHIRTRKIGKGNSLAFLFFLIAAAFAHGAEPECALSVKVLDRKSSSNTLTNTSGIYTIYEGTILESDACTGKDRGETIVFAAPGGELGGIATRVNGIDLLKAGQDATVYLTPPSAALGMRLMKKALSDVTGPSGQTTPFLCSRVPLSGPSLYWSTRTVTMQPSISNDPNISQADMIDAMIWAGAQWSTTNCSDFKFVIGEPTSERWVGYDWSGTRQNVNLITLRKSTAGDFYSEWLHSANQLALTSVTYIAGTGEILDADIELDGANFAFTNCSDADSSCVTVFDMRNTLTHEFGHVLGLDHPPSTLPNAAHTTMFADSPRGETQKRTLEQGDIDGICFIYPAGAPTKECYGVTRIAPLNAQISPAGGSCNQASSGGSFFSLLCLLVIMLLKARREANTVG